MMFSYFGHQGKVEEPLAFFSEQNYIICRGALDIADLDNLFNFYNQHIANSTQIFLRQSKKWEANHFTKSGGVSNAFLQPHCYQKGIPGSFADQILKITAKQKLQQALREISGIGPYNLVQTMFFDQKTTRPHQDWIYLDSKPNGYLIAAWIALEDISEAGIRFFVYPDSQNFQPKVDYDRQGQGLAIFDNFVREIDELLATNKYQIYAPAIQKGDIFFWGSRIIHGSIAGVDPTLRRRSLAAHFLPVGYKFGNLHQEVPITFAQKYNLNYRMLDYLNPEFEKHNSEQEKKSIWQKITRFILKNR